MRIATSPFRKLPVLSLFILFPCLILSYLPVITLRTIQGLHIDISLLYILVGIVIVSNTPLLARHFTRLYSSISWRFFLLFVSYTWVSAVWSTNPVRAVATAAFLTALFLVGSIIMLRFSEIREKRQQLTHYSLVTFALSLLWASWQIIADALGIPPAFTGLPAMYAGDVFGIARPTAFSLEPQFYGSILLIPLLWAAWNIFLHSKNLRLYYIVFISSLTMLVLTLSRGALLAALGGLVILLAYTRPSFVTYLKFVAFGVTSIALALCIVFTAGLLRKDTISGREAVAKTINQLSLGTIDISPPAISHSTPATDTPPRPAATSPGYIKSSTTSRLTMTDSALQLWSQTPHSLLFGVGVGGFGSALANKDPSKPIGSIVGNYYVEMLVETGLVGLLLFICFLVLLLWSVYRKKQWLLFSLAGAFLIQWLFFSGNANIIHVWVIYGLCLALPTKLPRTVHGQ